MENQIAADFQHLQLETIACQDKCPEKGGHVFGDHARQMADNGLAVIPLGRDRKPKVDGFDRWSRAPSKRTISEWADRHAEANIGVIPGLSGAWVADVDSDDEVDEVEDLLGRTPLHVKTYRGRHLYYDKPCERVPGNLRKYGLNVDFKAGNSVVIAPPSIHESGHIYRLEAADWSALGALPRPNVEQLRQFLKRQSKQTVAATKREMRDGSRKQWLNDNLCRHAALCDSFSDLLDVARTANMELANRGYEPLDDAIVMERAKKVWSDFEDGQIERWMGKRGVSKARRSDIDELARLDPKHASDAFMLLQILKIEHSARCRRNETFCITPKSMARDNVIPGWEWKRYMRGRDLLLQSKLIRKVSKFRPTPDGGVGAQYTLGC